VSIATLKGSKRLVGVMREMHRTRDDGEHDDQDSELVETWSEKPAFLEFEMNNWRTRNLHCGITISFRFLELRNSKIRPHTSKLSSTNSETVDENIYGVG